MERPSGLSDTQLRYPVPWDLVFGLTPHVLHRTQESLDEFTAGVTARMQPPSRFEGIERLPSDPRFLLVANHYQRKGLWILHTAAALTQGIRRRYGPGDPPVRWIVTANWPPLRIGGWRIPNPGDWLLPRVAATLSCYPVAFAASDPLFTSRSLRRLLKDAAAFSRPIGIFPEGVGGSAGTLAEPLDGVGRLMRLLAKQGVPAVPAAVSEEGALIIRFGEPIPSTELAEAGDPARLTMGRLALLLG